MHKSILVQMDNEELREMFQKELNAAFQHFNNHFEPTRPKTLMTRQEVAEFFSVDLSTIHNWCKKGKLNPLGIGARVYFDREEIEKGLIPLNSTGHGTT